MNERIKQLWEQAAKTTQGDSWEEQTKFMEKFAVLIVKECAEWLKQPVNQTPLSGSVMNIAADRLKEHFGVEE